MENAVRSKLDRLLVAATVIAPVLCLLAARWAFAETGSWGAVQFFVGLDGKQAGPFDLSTLGQMAARGQLTRETLVWKQGMSAWSPASAVGELGSLFGATPPPPPPFPPR